MKISENPISVKYSYNAPLKRVWKAITDHSEMIQWYFDMIPAFEAEIGFETHFLVTNEGREFTHRWEVTAIIPEKMISYRWRYDEYAGDSFVTFKLEAQDKMTELTLLINIVEDFEDGVPEFTLESCLGGWEYFLNQRLRNYLEK